MNLERNLSKRHYVNHNYHDHALAQNVDVVSDDMGSSDEEVRMVKKKKRRGPRGGVAVPFPNKLHRMLEEADREDGHSHIVSWQPHGRCFLLHKPKEFVSEVMPEYFKQSKLTSFQRQLNLYGFSRLTSGPDRGAYYHELFLRGKEFLCKKMVRTRVKGTGFKAASSPESEPNFYYMPPLPECSSPFNQNKKNNCYAKTQSQQGTTNKKKASSYSCENNTVETSKTNNVALFVLPDTNDGLLSSSHPDSVLLPGIDIDSSPSGVEEASPEKIMSSPPPVPVTPSLTPDVRLSDDDLLSSEWMLNDAPFPPPPPFRDEEQESDQMYFEGKQFHYIDSDFCECRKPQESGSTFSNGGCNVHLPSLQLDTELSYDETWVDMIIMG